MDPLTSSNITPYFYPRKEAEKEEEEVVELSVAEIESFFQLSFEESDPIISAHKQNFKKRCEKASKLSLKEADRLMLEMSQGKEIFYLSFLHILFIETIMVMKQLSQAPSLCKFIGSYNSINSKENKEKERVTGKQICFQLTVELTLLHRKLRECFSFLDGKINEKISLVNFVESKNLYMSVVDIYLTLDNVIYLLNDSEIKKLQKQLKKFIDVYYYLCYDEDFLKKNSKSLSNKPDAAENMIHHPPTSDLYSFFLKSLDTGNFIVSHFKEAINSLFGNFIKKVKDLPEEFNYFLDREKLIKELNVHSQKYFNALEDQYSGTCTLLIETRIKKKSHLEALKTFYENHTIYHQNVYAIQAMFPHIQEIMKPWYEHLVNNKDEENSKKITRLNKNLSELIETLKRELSFSQKKSKVNQKTKNEITIQLTYIFEMIKNLQNDHFLYCNAFLHENSKVISSIAQEVNYFFCTINLANEKAIKFHKSLFTNPLKPPCSAFYAIDLLIQKIFEAKFIIKDGKHLQATETTITNLFSLIYKYQILNNLLTDKLRLNNFSKSNIKDEINMMLQELINSFIEIHGSLEQMELYQNQKNNFSIMAAIKNFKEYLNCFSVSDFNANIVSIHFLNAAFGPVSPQKEFSNVDVPLIQSHLKIIEVMTQENLEPYFDNLKKIIKKQIDAATPANIFFWKLNYKYIVMSFFMFDQIKRIYSDCYKEVQRCHHPDEVLVLLHECVEKVDKIDKYNKCIRHLNIFGSLIIKAYPEIWQTFQKICDWDLKFCFFRQTIEEITLSNDKPIKPAIHHSIQYFPAKNECYTPSSSSREEENEEVEIHKPISILPSKNPDIRSLLLTPPNFLHENEEIYSISLRTFRRNEVIKNSFFRFTLLEETRRKLEEIKKNQQSIPHAIQVRAEIDSTLYCEHILKVVLSCLRVATEKSPHTHILSANFESRPLYFTHNGRILANIIAMDKPWFSDPSIQEPIDYQETVLKKAYWFIEEQQELKRSEQIILTCKKAWEDLLQTQPTQFSKPKLSELLKQLREFQKQLARCHQIKRQKFSIIPAEGYQGEYEKAAKNIPSLISGLEISDQCVEHVQEHIQGIKRAMDFYEILSNYQEKESMPLFFVTRSAEIQVSLLSQVLILALSRFTTAEEHPLFQQHKGRPLFHTHKVDKLWENFREYISILPMTEENGEAIKMLDTHLHHFVGDPRYPFPNKSVLTNQLIHMQEKVYMYHKLESGWLGSEDEKLIKKHFGRLEGKLNISEQREFLSKSIARDVDLQKQKTSFAFYLAEKILKL